VFFEQEGCYKKPGKYEKNVHPDESTAESGYRKMKTYNGEYGERSQTIECTEVPFSQVHHVGWSKVQVPPTAFNKGMYS